MAAAAANALQGGRSLFSQAGHASLRHWCARRGGRSGGGCAPGQVRCGACRGPLFRRRLRGARLHRGVEGVRGRVGGSVAVEGHGSGSTDERLLPPQGVRLRCHFSPLRRQAPDRHGARPCAPAAAGGAHSPQHPLQGKRHCNRCKIAGGREGSPGLARHGGGHPEGDPGLPPCREICGHRRRRSSAPHEPQRHDHAQGQPRLGMWRLHH
mmetsp:Transcript_61916/g.139533  ORF Transcript_61916/g.139533 Transcript_61916/m.139533 type:complete len:210 (-) Transcript_61916:514-1143(-)